MTIKLDVSSGDSVGEAMKQMLEKYKTCPDAVVNSAGITLDGYLLKMTDDRFDKVIDVNLKGTYRINKAAASAMKAAKLEYGSIVNISSIVGKLNLTIAIIKTFKIILLVSTNHLIENFYQNIKAKLVTPGKQITQPRRPV